MSKLQAFEEGYLRKKIPSFKPGDTVRVHVRVVEGDRERVQVFQGTVLRRQGGGLSETFTVRKVSFGVGTERTFPMHSPMVAKVEIKSRGTVRRAKLYYLRERVGKKARVKEMFVEGGLPESANIEHSEIEKKRLGLDQEPETTKETVPASAEVQQPASRDEARDLTEDEPASAKEKADKPEVEMAPEVETAPETEKAPDSAEATADRPAEEAAETEETAPASTEAPSAAEAPEGKTEDKPESEITPMKETESEKEKTSETEETPHT